MSRQPNPAFLRRAIELATQNVRTGAGGPFAALIVREGLENVWPLVKSSRKSCVVSSAIARSRLAGTGSHPCP